MIPLLPTAYLPPVSYLVACASAEEIFLEAWETYPKQTLRNRCIILGPNGKQTLSIPVTKPSGNQTKTKDISISQHLPWQLNHWRSIEAAYNKSPFLLYYKDYFLPFYEKPFTWLMDFNDELFDTLLMILRIDTEWQRTASFELYPAETLDERGKGKKHLLPLPFPAYHQVFSSRFGFIPNLSIIDLICNVGPDASSYIRELAGK